LASISGQFTTEQICLFHNKIDMTEEKGSTREEKVRGRGNKEKIGKRKCE
jgi:hypothetical protein